MPPQVHLLLRWVVEFPGLGPSQCQFPSAACACLLSVPAAAAAAGSAAPRDGARPNAGQLLQLGFDVAVPSAGPPVGRAAVEAWKTGVDAELAARR